MVLAVLSRNGSPSSGFFVSERPPGGGRLNKLNLNIMNVNCLIPYLSAVLLTTPALVPPVAVSTSAEASASLRGCSFRLSTEALTEAERTVAVNLLQKTKTDLLASVQGLSATQLSWKADSTRWSVAQCIEHIALAEIGIFQLQQGAMNVPADPARRAEVKLTDQQVVQFLTNRSGKAEAPAVIRPTGRFPSVAASLRAYGQQRDKTIAYVQTTPDDLRNHYWKHFIGVVDAYQTILLLAAHSERHRLQIEEVKATPGFPKQ